MCKAKQGKRETSSVLGKKVVLMVAVWACCHQALRNRVDRFLCRDGDIPLVMHAGCQLFKAAPCFFVIKAEQKSHGSHMFINSALDLAALYEHLEKSQI